MIYKTLYIMMLIGFAGCSAYAPGWKMKIVGLLLTGVNALLFWRG